MSAPDDPHAAALRRRSQRRRHLAWWVLGGSFALFVLGAVGVVLALVYHGERSVQRVEVEGIDEPGEQPGDDEIDVDEIEDVLHVLVAGSDRRDGLDEAARRTLGTGEAEGDRTDTIMLLRLDPSVDEVAILSFPRDLLVTRCDGSRGKINAAYQIGEFKGIGGASCLVQTIKDMSGLSIHHFVQVDFAGFLDLVDLVDGVTVYLEEPIDDPLAHINLAAGCQRLTGVDALGFVRHRASDSDYGRIARQQRFVKELVRESSRLGTVVNIPRMFQMVEAGASAVTTDQSLTLDKMRRIAFTLRNLETENVVARTVPADYQRIDHIDYEIVREEEAQALYRAFEVGDLRRQPADHDDDHDETADSDPGRDEAEEARREGADAGTADESDGAEATEGVDEAEGTDGADGSGEADSGGADSGGGGQSPAGGVAAPTPEERTFVGAQEPPAHCR